MGSPLRHTGALAAVTALLAACSATRATSDAGVAACTPPCGSGYSCVRGSCAPAACHTSADCPANEQCLNGSCGDQSCSPPCAAAQVCLDQLCLAKLPAACTSAADCGPGGSCVGGVCSQSGCDPACATGEVCLDDVCIPPSGTAGCAPPYTACASGPGLYCANLARDSSNCGACGQACSAGEICNGAGQCAVSCLAGEAECPAPGAAQRCVDIQADQQNCGACGNACPAGEACSKGACGATCAPPYVPCGAGQATYCADEQSDPSNCGACGASCAAGDGCVQGSCTAPCPAPFVECAFSGGVACTDTTWDPSNCGGCGVACATYCVRGVCAAASGSSTSTASGSSTSTGTSAGAASSTGSSTGSGSSTGTAAGTGTGSGGSSSGSGSGGLQFFSTLSLLAGQAGGPGTLDANGTAARFNGPTDVAVDGLGNLYVTDTSNDSIRIVALATGAVTTLAGSPGVTGTADGVGTSASFYFPSGIAADGAGNLFVADTANETLRKISVASGAVTTLAGTPASNGSADGVGSGAGFTDPTGLALDGLGNLYIADTGNDTVRKLVLATGAVTTFVGSPGVAGNVDGTGAAGIFSEPKELALDGSGNLFVSDSDLATIRQVVLATGAVTTIAGLAGNPGTADGVGSAARFERPAGMAAVAGGELFIADSFSNTLRELATVSQTVTTVAGAAGVQGFANGPGSTALFSTPFGLKSDGLGHLYVGDATNDSIREVNLVNLVVSTVAGAPPSPVSQDGPGTSAGFSAPQGLVDDGAGGLLVADSAANVIRRIAEASGAVTTVAGTIGDNGSSDGTGAAATFDGPVGLASDGAGDVFIADKQNSTVRQLVLGTSAVTTLAGSAVGFGSADGLGTAATFRYPTALAMDPGGPLFVADQTNDTIRSVTLPGGLVSTFAGQVTVTGAADGTGTAASFNFPQGLATDGAGHLFVADTGNSLIRAVVVATGAVTTLAGSPQGRGSADGIGSAASFDAPLGLAVDGAGQLLVADTGNGTVRAIDTATGAVTTLVGAAGQHGLLTGSIAQARLNAPAYLAVGPGGTLFLSDQGENVVLELK